MNFQWYVAKYVGDLRRREPRNFGLILIADDEVYFRFMGENEDGSIDGRRVRWAQSPETYKAWVTYWKSSIRRDNEELISSSRADDDNYYLEPSGKRIFGEQQADVNDFFDTLYSSLVEDPRPEDMSITQLSENVIRRLRIAMSVKKQWRYSPEDSSDEITFHYRYDNGVINLMQRVSLPYPDDRSWDNVHAAAWTLSHADKLKENGKTARPIALVKPRKQSDDGEQLLRQLKTLAVSAKVIDLSDENEAVRELSRTLQL